MRSLFARCHLMTAKDRLNLFLFPSCFLFLLRQLHFQFGRERFISFFGSVWGLWQFGYCAFMFFPQGARGGRRSRTQLQGESPTLPSTGCAGRPRPAFSEARLSFRASAWEVDFSAAPTAAFDWRASSLGVDRLHRAPPSLKATRSDCTVASAVSIRRSNSSLTSPTNALSSVRSG